MKIKLNRQICSPWGVFQAGEEVDFLPDPVAIGLVEADVAERVGPDPTKPSAPEPEQAEIEAPEKAVVRRGRPRKLPSQREPGEKEHEI